jgi:hypothetical protein
MVVYTWAWVIRISVGWSPWTRIPSGARCPERSAPERQPPFYVALRGSGAALNILATNDYRQTIDRGYPEDLVCQLEVGRWP